MAWNIFCDFDGTIALVDVVDSLLERFAAPAWREIEEGWRAGLIGSHECMASQIALLDASRAELDEYLDQIEIDADFPAFVAEARARGHAIVVLSDGLDYAIRRVLARHGLNDIPVLANCLEQTGERDWRLSFPNSDANCQVAAGNCKCAALQHSRRRAGQCPTLLIGDGVSDFCAARTADLVFAKHKLIGHCARNGLPHHAIGGFVDALLLIELPGLIEMLGQVEAPGCITPFGTLEPPATLALPSRRHYDEL